MVKNDLRHDLTSSISRVVEAYGLDFDVRVVSKFNKTRTTQDTSHTKMTREL